MLNALLYGAMGMIGALIVYTVYDGIFEIAHRISENRARKAAQQNSKRRKH